jgi:hypothetical protein
MWLKHPEAPTAFELENVGTTGARGLLTGSSTSIPLKRSSSSALPTPFMSSREFLSTGLQTSTNVKSRPYSAYPSSSPSTGKLPASKFGDAAKAASPAMRALMRIHLTHTVVFPSKNDNNKYELFLSSNVVVFLRCFHIYLLLIN